MKKTVVSIVAILGIALAVFAAGKTLDFISYEIADKSIDVRIVVLNGHEYVIASSRGTSGTSISVVHAASCQCIIHK